MKWGILVQQLLPKRSEAESRTEKHWHTRPAPATVVAGTVLAITRQLLQLERCSNPLRIQQVF